MGCYVDLSYSYFFQTVFDPMFIAVYNLFYTSLPVLAIGVFDQDVNEKNSIAYPQLYSPGHTNLLFNKKECLRSVLYGFYTSCILFFIPYGKVYQIDLPPLFLAKSGKNSQKVNHKKIILNEILL